MTLTIKTTVVKSVHIKECWPYEYVVPDRRTHTRAAMDRQNELRRARYAKAKALKTTKGKKLLGLQVFEMDIDICNRLNKHET